MQLVHVVSVMSMDWEKASQFSPLYIPIEMCRGEAR